ncbi:hypothetical protein [Streptomyces yanii]|uniref:Nucleoside phosphorylase domain-containing protein n=1 Tax=Streptomyces yanii TaxID=78510 RepID=A0ABV5R8H8_9ACTN
MRPGWTGTHLIGTVMQYDLDSDTLLTLTGETYGAPLTVGDPDGPTLATGDSFIDDEAARARLAAHAPLVDMEGYALATAAHLAGVSLRIVKHVSDDVGEQPPRPGGNPSHSAPTPSRTGQPTMSPPTPEPLLLPARAGGFSVSSRPRIGCECRRSTDQPAGAVQDDMEASAVEGAGGAASRPRHQCRDGRTRGTDPRRRTDKRRRRRRSFPGPAFLGTPPRRPVRVTP